MSETKNDNMALWNQVCTTNPDDTKKVSARGGFTSICAQSQMREATKHFGVFGQTWWIENEEFTFLDGGMCLYKARLHIGKDSGTAINSSTLWTTNGKPDKDFAKKVTTDALTKALSKMGFNADVFLGLYDDNKYVQEMKEKHAEPTPEPTAKIKFITGIKSMMGDNAPKSADDWWAYVKPLCDALGEKVVAIKDIAEDSPLWTKLADKAVQEFTRDA